MSGVEKFAFWTPRLLSIAFVLFLSIFALDVFSEYSGWGIALPLFIHLMPSLALLAVVAIAWRYDWVGAIMFIGFSLWYVWQAGLDRPWSWYAFIALPPLVVGVLFLLSWRQKRARSAREQS